MITTPAKSPFRMADLFCGAGGMTQGAIDSGYVRPVLAVNHWRTAILSHENNHQDVKHLCARVEDMNLRDEHDLPDFNLLAAGIECTHHSVARGGRPVNDQKRTSAWRVIDWIDHFRPEWCVFENVSEFLKWGPVDDVGRKIKSKAGTIFNAWAEAIRSHGYHVEWRILNAADFGAATTRKRLFIIARRGSNESPFCWPDPTHEGRWKPAREIIDWSRPCPSIFARKRPLADKTLQRIEAGLRKFVEPYIVKMRGTSTAQSIDAPLPTVTAGGRHEAVAVPYTVDIHHGSASAPSKSKSIDDPLATIVTKDGHAVVAPFLAAYHNGEDSHRRTHGVDEPLPTQDTSNRFGVAMPYLFDVNHGGNDDRCQSIEKPIGTVTTKRGKALSLPFLTKYYGTAGAVSVDDPLDTITTKDRFGLAMASLVETMNELKVVDIGFRMLDDDELSLAQGFPSDYELHGNKGDRIRQIGNAVPPPMMAAICRAIAEDN